jgi:Domain of unknown function (DUF4279)
MSTMKTEPESQTTFAAIRFIGDDLEPERLTEALHITPTTAYRKGEIYKRSRGREVRGRTGVWLLSSEGQVQSSDLNEHLIYLLRILFPIGSDDRASSLLNVLREEHLEADVPAFWYGTPGAHVPEIRADIRAAFARLPAQIEEDFHKAA